MQDRARTMVFPERKTTNVPFHFLNREEVVAPLSRKSREPNGDQRSEVFGLLAQTFFPPSPPCEQGLASLGNRHQLPQRVCSGFAPDSMHSCINVDGQVEKQGPVSKLKSECDDDLTHRLRQTFVLKLN